MVLDSVAAEERIRGRVIETPLILSGWLSKIAGAQVYLKLENLQNTGSFKLRGAANKLLSLPAPQMRRGVVTASNGNHALAVAVISGMLGIPAEVFVSEHIDPARLDKIRAAGASASVVDGDCLLAESSARSEAERSGRVYISPYNDMEVMAGQGSIAVELLRREPELDAVLIAVGGGGLIGGVGSHFKKFSPTTEIVGCWPSNSRALYECLRAGEIIDVEEHATLSVSTAGGIEPGSVTFPIAQRVIDHSVLIDESSILAALRGVYRHDRQLVEGAAGVAVAGFLQEASRYAGKRVAILLCGGNADAALVERIQERP
jgi:threonine dehydratase